MMTWETDEPPKPFVYAWQARKRLQRVQQRCALHIVDLEARGATMLEPKAVVTLLLDILAASRGELN